MHAQPYLIDAVNVVLEWNLSEQALRDAVIAQAFAMSGVPVDDEQVPG
jgi:hypothetical protein